ncbi:MAG: carboxypeptidase-like regulatory domain-containing protein [Flavobacteriales bacterium]|nr:carboxypeptidase-like regulatory domain-containing protein [Flavobacteriales bacterium]
MNIIGKIFDAATGAALPGATVAVMNRLTVYCITAPCPQQETLSHGTSTANDGSFQVNVEPGQVVKISYIGFQTNYPILSAGVSNEIQLQPASYEQGEAVVYGTIKGVLSIWGKLAVLLGFLVLIGGTYYLIKKA